MRRVYRDFQARRLLVNLRGGDAISGILWSENKELLVLRDARLFAPDGPDGGRALDGEALVERSNIEFGQVLPA